MMHSLVALPKGICCHVFFNLQLAFALIINTRVTLSAFSAALSFAEIVWQGSRPDKSDSRAKEDVSVGFGFLSRISGLSNAQMYVKIETEIKKDTNSEI
jgi:hypothetical protein